jgi:hypothetical protein
MYAENVGIPQGLGPEVSPGFPFDDSRKIKRSKYGGMVTSDMQRLREWKQEHARLERILIGFEKRRRQLH